MAKAVWNEVIIAESEHTEVVEGNHYFPPESLRREFFKPSRTTSLCPWRGTASYYTLVVNGRENADAAWVYESPKPAAKHIAGHVAFWKGVVVED